MARRPTARSLRLRANDESTEAAPWTYSINRAKVVESRTQHRHSDHRGRAMEASTAGELEIRTEHMMRRKTRALPPAFCYHTVSNSSKRKRKGREDATPRSLALGFF